MDMVSKLSRALAAEPVSFDGGPGRHHQLVLPSSTTPVVVDLIAAAQTTPPRQVAVLLPGGGLNVRANYCTAQHGRSLARFLADHGYLVIGITPREDALTPPAIGPHCADWGLRAHRRDLQPVLAAVQDTLGLPYDLLGHSAGAALALDTAAQPDAHPRRVIVLDTTGPYDPATEPESAARADALTTALQEQLAQGVHVVDPGLKGLFARAAADPGGSSPVPRPDRAGPTFSNLGLLHYALTHTRRLPGPANWIYHQGHSSGSFEFGATPAQDRFTLDRTPLDVWRRAIEALGSGVQPTALLRDLAAVWAGRTDVYRIDWSAIRADVVWVNAELGRGDHDLGARLIQAGGARVDYRVVPGYGHGDVVWAPGAAQEIWPLLLG
ncbi:alpha/beta hydrolase [Kitasatospora sp. NBC_01266]|uniref:alpha/beta hydrolase n=1 Tax=Kitasatospora sp. NBC_01266 TaxID=2903572 RepID=UPI002E2FDAD7|nr:thioesterase domain-containing protein [Kitasatospora sp. NBC_01266]